MLIRFDHTRHLRRFDPAPGHHRRRRGRHPLTSAFVAPGSLGEAGLVPGQDHDRERHYRLDTAGLAPVRGLLGDLGAPAAGRPRPPVAEHDIDALATEVRRTVRERRRRPATTTTATAWEETA